MIVDSSAIVAILKQEPDWKEFLNTLNAANEISISAGTYFAGSAASAGKAGAL